MGDVELGFIEKIEPWKLKSKYFPNKVGGYPAWLSLQNLPSSDQLSCKKCSKPLAFLCQLYAPFVNSDHSFHRTVFVFLCRNADCSAENDASNIRVFRCDLPRVNGFYACKPYEEKEENCDSPSAADYGNLCAVCGARGPKFCGQCKAAHYCSKEHQAIDWKTGHKMVCKKEDLNQKYERKFLFPEFNMDLEPEEIEQEQEKSEEQVMKEYRELLTSGRVVDNDNEESEEDLAQIAARETDKQFQRFRTRIKEYPNQVIRYDRAGEPLWVSSQNKPQDIPPCEKCGKARQFEFQVMPQLLVHLKVDCLGRSIDWGTILIYTCSESCKNDIYVEEVAFKQDYDPVDAIRNK